MMTEEKNLVQELFDGLLKHLIILSLPADYQKEYMGFGLTGDELALDFDTYYTLHKEQYLKEEFINQEQKIMLDALESFFEVRSGEHNEDFWEGVNSHSDWGTVRTMAKDCIDALGKQDYGIKVRYEYDKTYFDGQEQRNMHSTKTELVKKSIS
jgi:hypothetical protein